MPTTSYNGDVGIVNNLPCTDSAGDLAWQLLQHALLTAFFAAQLFTLPLRLLLRNLIPSPCWVKVTSWVTQNVSRHTQPLHSLWFQLPPYRFVFLARSQAQALRYKLSRLTVLLEENIELMSRVRNDERKDKVANAPSEESLSKEDMMTSPITASAIYHAALANNRTLDDLLDTFDGGNARMTSSMHNERETSVGQTIGYWANTASVPPTTNSLDIEKLQGSDMPSGTLVTQQMAEAQPVSHGPLKALETADAAALRHRSPVPSMSTTIPQSSASSTSSVASRNTSSMPVANKGLRNEAAVGSSARCDACDKGYSDSEQSLNGNEKGNIMGAISPYRTVPQSRWSRVPRRSGRSLTPRQGRSPI